VQGLLLFSIFVISVCGLVYELVACTMASYLLGDSVTQFSTVIGCYLTSMGLGAWLSRYVRRNLVGTFVQVEILVGVVGGFSCALMFLLFDQVASFRVLLYSLMTAVGCMVGLELPLMMRILKGRYDFKDLVAKAFTFDYVGALAASLLFPLVLVPQLGLVRSGFLFGILNVLVAFWTLHFFSQVPWTRFLRLQAALALGALTLGFIHSERIVGLSESMAYPDPVIFSKSSPYQRLTLTKGGDDLRFFLNGNLQFSSRDEYRYHEALVHPGLGSVSEPQKVLVLGGGDGLALREVLKVSTVGSVKLVDLDPEVTRLFSGWDPLKTLNQQAFSSPKVSLETKDAFVWLKDCPEKFDFVVVDFPDPSNYSVGKLYSLTFFRMLRKVLAPGGRVVVQSTSPFVAPKAFWCVVDTMGSAGFITTPYHAYVPSFGEWGFVMGGNGPFREPKSFPPGLKFLDRSSLAQMLTFPKDMARVPTEVNRLTNQVLVRYFEEEWENYARN
jgi:spermidine synthase